ncbi:unnamed protein product [Coffea canephora]|uniref:Uncharacterized protein n=1 Tax=Coffea canephora TaxID=49390 RepID=A0A068V9Z7_COFCA|nr:unnamed protein product [Coffea canephora]
MTLSLANERIGKLFQLEEDLETLRESVAMIQAVLADAEKKQICDQAVQLWLRRLEGVAFDAENLLDELNYEVLRCQLVGKVRSFILSSDINIVFQWRMASKIRDINKKLNKINKEASDFRLVRNQGKTFPPSTTAKVTLNRETDSVVGHNVVGRAKDETSLVETLLSLSEKAVSVIPILGMGGLGKTTLAQSDTGVERNMLIELWMAEGFLQADVNSQMMMEEIGMNYLRILLQSSLFEETSHARGTYYKMHDLVHDLAESVSKSTKVINSETRLVDNSNQVRYLAIDSFGEHTVKLLESLSTSLHTLFIRNSLFGDHVLQKWYINLFGGGMLKKLKNLYVLNLYCAQNKELLITIDKLIHLRYIELFGFCGKSLPKSVCKLYNLQTLRLSECSDLKEFPKRISLSLHDFGGIEALPDWLGNFTALEYLHLSDFKKLRHLPSDNAMRRLTKLKHLWVFCSPLLKERCTPQSSGPDSQWSKVSHIQYLDISG